MDADRLITGFRKKFGSPQNLLLRLGFDSQEIDEMMGTHDRRRADDRRRARDEGESVSAEEAIADLAVAMLDMPREEFRAQLERASERLV
jgi:hypothetical protein